MVRSSLRTTGALLALGMALAPAAQARVSARSSAFQALHNKKAQTLNPDRLAAFLTAAAARAEGLPDREAFHLLRDSTEQLTDMSQFKLALGVHTTLKGIKWGAYEANSHKDAALQLRQGFAAVAANAAALSGEADQFFPAMMACARATSAGVSEKNKYVALRGFMSSSIIFPELIPTGILVLTVEATRKASDRPCTDAEGAKVLDVAIAAMEAAGATQDRGVYLEAATGSAGDLTAVSGYRVLKHYAKKLVRSQYLVDAFDRVTLESALRTARRADTYEAAVTILKGALDSLK